MRYNISYYSFGKDKHVIDHKRDKNLSIHVVTAAEVVLERGVNIKDYSFLLAGYSHPNRTITRRC